MTIFANGFLVDDAGVLQVTLSAPGTPFDNAGWAEDGTGNRYIADAGGAVPAGAVFMGGRAYTNDGALYCTDESIVGEFMAAGLAVRADGAQYVTTSSPDLIIAGLGRTHTGQLCVSTFAPSEGDILLEDDTPVLLEDDTPLELE